MYNAGFVQFCPVRYDVAANIESLYRLLSGVKADLLVLPELANSGYMYATPEELAPYAEPGDGRGPFLSALQRLARSTGGLIVAGFAEAGAAGLYNSAAALDADGVHQVYRKTHLYADEKDLFLPGDSGFQVLEHRGLRIGMMICFDWFFPESARTLALAGAQILAHPSNLVMPWCQKAMVTRCLENNVFSITANRYGTETIGENALTFTGGSQMLDTKGNCLLYAPEIGDCVAATGISPQMADQKIVGKRNHAFADRRPDMYHLAQ